MIIESVREFIKTCPLLKGGKINVNYLEQKTMKYSIENVPSEKIIKKYACGDSLCQFNFVFASREFYSADVVSNITNSSFYEQFSDWLLVQSEKGNLPRLAVGTAQYIEAVTSGYLFDSCTSDARYQVQCRLVYYVEGRDN